MVCTFTSKTVQMEINEDLFWKYCRNECQSFEMKCQSTNPRLKERSQITTSLLTVSCNHSWRKMDAIHKIIKDWIDEIHVHPNYVCSLQRENQLSMLSSMQGNFVARMISVPPFHFHMHLSKLISYSSPMGINNRHFALSANLSLAFLPLYKNW